MISRKYLIQISECIILVACFAFCIWAFAATDKTHYDLKMAVFMSGLLWLAFRWCPHKIGKLFCAVIFASSIYSLVKQAMGFGFVYLMSDYIFGGIIVGILLTYLTIFVFRIYAQTQK